METRAILAEPGDDDTLTVYLPSQEPHMHRRWIAETVGIPEHLLRIVAPDIGGGFGAKMHLYPEEVLCAWLARELGSPSNGGNHAPKAIRRPATAGPIPSTWRSPSRTTAASAA